MTNLSPAVVPAQAKDWRLRGLCAAHEDPDLWFPLGRGQQFELQVEQAKAVCARCPVVAECHAWALEQREPYGVWGGVAEAEREAMLTAAAAVRRRSRVGEAA